MFVPLVFTMDTLHNTENYFHWAQFYMYAEACIRNKWPIISHERYFERFSHVEEIVFGTRLQWISSAYCMSSVPTTEEMLALKTYPVPQAKEDALIAKYASQFDCWVDLLKNENSEFKQIIGELLDRITDDFSEKPEGILIYEYLPKALLSAAKERGIPVVFQGGGVARPPLTLTLNAFSLINANNAVAVKVKYDRFISENPGIPMLTHKGLLRLFISEQYIANVHNINNEPEYEVGVLYNNLKVALYHTGQEYVSDQELSARAKAKYNKVLIRTRPGFAPTVDALDDSPTCFHFCCKCKRVLGFSTKGMFEAMLAGRIAHEYGSFIFHSFCNDGIEDDSKGLAPIEFLNFVMFGLCTPFTWLTDPEYLRFLLSSPSEKEQYMRSFHYYTQGISKEDLELYYMTPGRMYRLGDSLYFTSGHKPHEYAAYYSLGGLHTNSGICTWSIGESTSFAFDLAEHLNEPLMISVVLYEVAIDWDSSKPSQTVSCEVNGIGCGFITLTPGKKYLRFTIPAECYKDNLQVTFRYSYLYSNGNIKMAVAFERMYINRAGQRPIEDAMSNEIAALANRISELEAEDSEQKVYISELEMHNAEQGAQISRLEAHNAEQKARISGLEAYNAEQKARISGLEAYNTEQSAQIFGLEAHNVEQSAQISGLEAKIQSIYSSRSWKLGNGIIKTVRKVIPPPKSPS